MVKTFFKRLDVKLVFICILILIFLVVLYLSSIHSDNNTIPNPPSNTDNTNPPSNTDNTNPTSNTANTNPTSNTANTNPTSNTANTNPTSNTPYTNSPINTSYTNPTSNTSYTNPTSNTLYTNPTSNTANMNPTSNSSYTNPTSNSSYTNPTSNTANTNSTSNTANTNSRSNTANTNPTSNSSYTNLRSNTANTNSTSNTANTNSRSNTANTNPTSNSSYTNLRSNTANMNPTSNTANMNPTSNSSYTNLRSYRPYTSSLSNTSYTSPLSNTANTNSTSNTANTNSTSNTANTNPTSNNSYTNSRSNTANANLTSNSFYTNLRSYGSYTNPLSNTSNTNHISYRPYTSPTSDTSNTNHTSYRFFIDSSSDTSSTNPTSNTLYTNLRSNTLYTNPLSNRSFTNPSGVISNLSQRFNERYRFGRRNLDNLYNTNPETQENRLFNDKNNFNDFDTSSLDTNNETRPSNNDRNANPPKNYDAEDFEESTATNQFFLPDTIVFESNLNVKINNFRRQMTLRNRSYLTCNIVVDRTNLLDESKRIILSKCARSLKGHIEVEFKNELGYDAGGLTKEWFNLVIKEALNINLGFFCNSQDETNTLRPSSIGKIHQDYKLYYRFVGRVIGMAIIQDCKVTTNFDRIVYKYLLSKKFKFSDLQIFDANLYRGLKYYLDHDIDNEELTFIHEYERYNSSVSKELFINGNNVTVTEKNKKSYIKLKTEMILYGLIKDQLNAMKKGLFDIIEPDLLTNFSESEFEILLCGISDIDINDWKNNTDYYLYDRNDSVIRWFWRLVEEITVDQRKKLLQFATGSDRVPYGGFANLMSNGNVNRFTISRSNKSNAHLPDAHTCFSRIDIPEYYSYENLKEKFLVAISECSEGFGEL